MQGTSRRGTREAIEKVSDSLKETAKARGELIEPSAWDSYGERVKEPSKESIVYIDKSRGTVTKIQNPFALLPMKGDNAAAVIYDHVAHNILFPDTRYTFKGITEENGDARIVLEQPYVEAYRRATDKEVEKYLREKGFRKEGYYYTNDIISLTDVTGDNVLVGKDGKLYFIDDVIRFEKSPKEAVAELTEKFYPDEAGIGKAAIRESVNRLSERYGEDAVTIADSIEDIEDAETRAYVERQHKAGGRVPGWYDAKTGTVHLYLPDVTSRYDAERTILHETVGHKGMRALLGEDSAGDIIWIERFWRTVKTEYIYLNPEDDVTILGSGI